MSGVVVDRYDYVVPVETRDYYRFVMVDLVEFPAGLYGLEERRAELHARMCGVYGLTLEVSRRVTGDMDRIVGGAEGLHWALQGLRGV